MKKLLVISAMSITIYACNSANSDKSANPNVVYDKEVSEGGDKIPTPGGDVAAYDPQRGQGKFTTVDIGNKLDMTLAGGGEKIYGVKCSGCHKLTNEKLVGPGWKGVSERNKPEWIMNFITNTNTMIDKDPKLQEQLQLCLVRMPDQSLADNEARQLLEFMRKNDGVK